MRKPYSRMIMHAGQFLVSDKPTWTSQVRDAWVMTKADADMIKAKLTALGYERVHAIILNPETMEFIKFVSDRIENEER